MYNQSLDRIQEAEAAGEALVIRPKSPVAIGRLEKDRQKLEALYNDGYHDAEALYPKMQEFLFGTKERIEP